MWGCLRVLNATVGKISENKNAIENVYYFHDEVLSAVVACPLPLHLTSCSFWMFADNDITC